MDDNQFKRLLDALDLSWQGYRKVRKGIKKRLSRHMEQTGCMSIDEYLRRVGNTPEIKLLMTNSAKYAHYAPGMLKTRVTFGSLEDCVRSAIAGHVVRDESLWAT